MCRTLRWILLTPLLVRALKWKVSMDVSKEKKMEERFHNGIGCSRGKDSAVAMAT